MQQRHLALLDIPWPHKKVWAQLDNEQRQAVIEVLARLMVQAMVPEANEEENDNE